jgi:hypothetical protein
MSFLYKCDVSPIESALITAIPGLRSSVHIVVTEDGARQVPCQRTMGEQFIR